MIIPSHIQIEPINGVCTSRCSMCTIDSWTRPVTRMNMETFEKILRKFIPYQEHIEYLSLQGWGETLLDPGIDKKIALAKKLGFRGIGFATNCTELNYRMSRKLLMAGLDTIICSIDGVRADTHEAIRVGTDFHEVVANVKQFIDMRKLFGHTKVIVRFIRQKLNEEEWPEFKRKWEHRLDKKYGDAVISFDIVDCDSKVKGFSDADINTGKPVPEYCDQLYKRLIVFSDGRIPLCCADDNGEYYGANVLDLDPIEAYNDAYFNKYREMMKEGKRLKLRPCNTCTIPRSDETKTD